VADQHRRGNGKVAGAAATQVPDFIAGFDFKLAENFFWVQQFVPPGNVDHIDWFFKSYS